MKISSSSITMSSQSVSLEAHSKEESMKLWVGNNPNSGNSQNQGNAQVIGMPQDILELSKEAKAKLAQFTKPTDATDEVSESEFALSDKDKQKIILVQKMIEMLTGKKIKIYTLGDFKLKQSDQEMAAAVRQNALQQRQGWGLEYDYHESHYESQKMSFSSQGMVKTEDGREIRFTLDVSMSREFMSSQHVSIRAGDAVMKDPLVVNFGGSAPALTDQKYSFDIDSDGKADQISFLLPDSGFLCLDLNNDGIINDGKELFGTQSGNGFNDLAQYDNDGNQWIDENDPIYDRLRIWTKDSEGNDILFALGQKGIGAIYLGNVSTDFSLKSNSNKLQGEIKRTGIFLRENGTAGTIQHIDLAI